MADKQIQTLRKLEISTYKDQAIIVQRGRAGSIVPETGHGTVEIEFRDGRIKDFKVNTTHKVIDTKDTI